MRKAQIGKRPRKVKSIMKEWNKEENTKKELKRYTKK